VVKEAGLRSAVVIRVGSTPTPRKVLKDNFSAINSVVEYQVSNLLTWVRFPNGALELSISINYSAALLIQW